MNPAPFNRAMELAAQLNKAVRDGLCLGLARRVLIELTFDRWEEAIRGTLEEERAKVLANPASSIVIRLM